MRFESELLAKVSENKMAYKTHPNPEDFPLPRPLSPHLGHLTLPSLNFKVSRWSRVSSPLLLLPLSLQTHIGRSDFIHNPSTTLYIANMKTQTALSVLLGAAGEQAILTAVSLLDADRRIFFPFR